MSTIIYHAATSTMGETSEFQAEKFRAWAEDQLKNEYPEYEIYVVNEESLTGVWTDDEEKKEEIAEFASRLWDKATWDWMEYVAISPEGCCYGRSATEDEAEEKAIENWKSKWGGDAEPIPEFTVKLDDGTGYDE